MARKYKGNKVDGWVVIDKPVGVTSIQALAKARWAYQAGKAGHAGTLDPLATGVLAIALGEATKTAAPAQPGLKTSPFPIPLRQATATHPPAADVHGAERTGGKEDKSTIWPHSACDAEARGAIEVPQPTTAD